MRKIESEWLSYRCIVLPKDAHAIQVRETKKAFYAGAKAMADRMLDITEQADIDDLVGELDNYKHLVEKGIA